MEKAAKELGYDFSGVDAAKNEKDLYGLRYSEFVVPIVKAVQELSNQNDVLKAENETLKSRLDKIEALLANNTTTSVNATMSSSNIQSLILNNQNAKLEQDIPNPFTGNTTIHCYIPENNGNVYLNFYHQSGAILKSIKVTGEGKNTITLTANELAAGTYQYVLVVDGKVVDRKTMVKQQ